MDTAKALLKLRTAQRSLAVRIVFHLRWLKHLHERNAHALGNGGNVLKDSHIHKYILPDSLDSSQLSQMDIELPAIGTEKLIVCGNRHAFHWRLHLEKNNPGMKQRACHARRYGDEVSLASKNFHPLSPRQLG